MTTEEFESWMQEMDFGPAAAAYALGLRVRTVSNYRTGDDAVPKPVEFLCKLLRWSKENGERHIAAVLATRIEVAHDLPRYGMRGRPPSKDPT